MRRGSLAAALAALLAAALPACSSGSDSGGPAKLRFQSLAWQQESLQANKDIVATWNAEHPDIQVEYVQGDWDSVGDQLLTSFEGGTAPDVIHYESPGLSEFADRGNLLDLADRVPDGLQDDIRDSAWDTVRTADGKVFGVPFLQESQVVIANRKLLQQAGVEVPTVDSPWSWEDFARYAKQLTVDSNGDGKAERYGTVFPLKQATNKVLNLSLNYGGAYFTEQDGKYTAVFGDAEKVVPQRIHDMIYRDRSAAPEGVGMGGADPLPGFFAGKYAMLPAAIWFRQQVVEQAEPGFDWVTLPPLEGNSQEQGAAAQTLSVSADSKYPDEAMQFIAYFLDPENQAKLAHGDWLLPTSEKAAEAPILQDEKTGWDVAVASGKHLKLAPFQQVKGYAEWKSKIADPAFQEYFSNRISLDDLGSRLTEEGNQVLARYQR